MLIATGFTGLVFLKKGDGRLATPETKTYSIRKLISLRNCLVQRSDTQQRLLDYYGSGSFPGRTRRVGGDGRGGYDNTEPEGALFTNRQGEVSAKGRGCWAEAYP